MTLWIVAIAAACSAGLSLLLTPLCARLARGVGLIDLPGGHKAHGRAVPLAGGLAMLGAFLIPAAAALLAVQWLGRGQAPPWLPDALAVHLPGALARAPLAVALLGGAVAMASLGLVDDIRAFGAVTKLLGELVVLVACVGMVPQLRVLTVLGEPYSAIATVLWMLVITNAFNFLDNMDGLSAGVAAIVGAGLLASSLRLGQVFVPAGLAMLIGSLVGFLPYNFHPARSFMGDAGSLVIGFLLGAFSCLTTYVEPGEPFYRYGIFLPVVLMAIPLYDTVSVVLLRVRAGQNPMVGDRRHFSHRLVRRGMTVPKAVTTIYLCTAATALGAVLLPKMDNVGAAVIFVQTLLILLVVALLESGEARS